MNELFIQMFEENRYFMLKKKKVVIHFPIKCKTTGLQRRGKGHCSILV